jgi:sialidase-1
MEKLKIFSLIFLNFISIFGSMGLLLWLVINYLPIWSNNYILFVFGSIIGIIMGIISLILARRKKHHKIMFQFIPILFIFTVSLIVWFFIENPFETKDLVIFIPNMAEFLFFFSPILFLSIAFVSISLIHKSYPEIKNWWKGHGEINKNHIVALYLAIFLIPGPGFLAIQFHFRHNRYVNMNANQSYYFTSGIVSNIDLFTAGQEGYHTFRIPSLISLPNETILAFCEARKYSTNDHGKIDLVMRRSTNGGQTWSPIQIIHSEGFEHNEWNTVGNPCPVFDNDTGVIFLPYNINNALGLIVNSSNLGESWSSPQNITSLVNPIWRTWDEGSNTWERHWHAFGPGHGIQLQFGTHKGRLAIPSYGGIGKSHLMYSDDNGISWSLSNQTSNGGECEAVELVNQTIYMTLRNNQGRMKALSNDGGESIGIASFESQLSGPACMSSIVRYSDITTQSSNVILFSGPDGNKRNNLTIRVSRDETETWLTSKTLYDGPAAYSDTQVLENGTICVLVERGHQDPYQYITFAQFSLEWVEN